ncbi:FG-GAP repeat domain-containing protein [Paenarthrobacter sp. RAF54_2]|uniref:FG-GAP repeat domain-containing protein n=1 Tax=Paenarthrobacter sp. RAF54_2 TaxID=3233061 RepID=UPI003F98B60E
MRRFMMSVVALLSMLVAGTAVPATASADDFLWHNLVQEPSDAGEVYSDLVTIGNGGQIEVYAANGESQPQRAAGNIGAVDAVLMPGDWDGDGHADWVVRTPDGQLLRVPGWSGGTQINQIGWRWDVMTALTSPGDWDGDGAPDVLARDGSGALWMYKGNGDGGWFPGRVQVGWGWNVMNAIFSGHDFSGDGPSDVIARDTNGQLWLYPGNGAGGWQNRIQIGWGWQGMDLVAAPGDYDNDGRGDVIAQDDGGTIWLYQGNGIGGFTGQRWVMDIPTAHIFG